MKSRKAFLIGVESYGDGFAALPAVNEDLRLFESALQVFGYEIARCSAADLSNASDLDTAMRRFCASGGPEDIRLLYFTGHGISADGVNWVIPSGVNRNDALVSQNQRVSTDLSKTVALAQTGLVLIIDACRDPADVPQRKGAAQWGDSARIERAAECRFIRFFGCSPNELCQIVSSPGKPPSSLITTLPKN